MTGKSVHHAEGPNLGAGMVDAEVTTNCLTAALLY